MCGGLSYLEVFNLPILFQQKSSWAKLFQDKNSCIESLVLMPTYCIGDSLPPRSVAEHDDAVMPVLASFVNFSSTSSIRRWIHLSACRSP